MSNVGPQTNAASTNAQNPSKPVSVVNKEKNKLKSEEAIGRDNDDDDDDDDDEEEEGDEEEVNMEDEDEEENYEEIDPSAILPTGRRTRGVKVDYSSAEAFEKAGLKNDEGAEGEEEEEFRETS